MTTKYELTRKLGTVVFYSHSYNTGEIKLNGGESNSKYIFSDTDVQVRDLAISTQLLGAVSFSAPADGRVEPGEPKAIERFREGTTVTFEPKFDDETEKKVAKEVKEEFW
ncbi:hypothetical protein Q7P35_009624 [Cladosporium inversicolor]